MYFSDLSCSTPERNLAWDEACVELADGFASGSEPFELLRVWSFPKPTVVVGRASRVQDEVYLDRCQRDDVPVLRRSSGGSTIVAGPGCYMYSLLISYEKRPTWRSLDVAHYEVMSRVQTAVVQALARSGRSVKVDLEGTCDLTVAGRKFSGNSLRCKKATMMYHGTLLLDMPLSWVSDYLKEPPRQPDYREKRTHETFVRNLLPELGLEPSEFIEKLTPSLREVWNGNILMDAFPMAAELDAEIEKWMENRYTRSEWHFDR